MKSIKVTILGRQYPLRVREEDEEMMIRIAQFVDERFKTFKKELSSQNETTIMVLSCLSIAEELFTQQEGQPEAEPDYKLINNTIQEMLSDLKKSNNTAG